MQGDIDLITHFDSSEVHERGIKDDPLGIADLGNGLDHGYNTMFYGAPIVNRVPVDRTILGCASETIESFILSTWSRIKFICSQSGIAEKSIAGSKA
jgi:hypothetical protein